MRYSFSLLPKTPDLAIDIGTSKIAIYTRDEGFELIHPSLLCLRTTRSGTQKVMAFGSRAKEFLGREPIGVETIKPLRGGVIEHLKATRLLLQAMMAEGHFGGRLAKPRIVVGAPHAISTIERNAFFEAARSLNAKSVHVVAEPVASALGAGLDVCSYNASMIVDIGSGITEVMVLSCGDVVCSESVRVGGDDITQALVQHLKKRHDMIVGETSAELLKPLIPGPLYTGHARDVVGTMIAVKGLDVLSRMPCQRDVPGFELSQAIERPVQSMVRTIKRVVEKVPPELLSDLCERGLTLAGGSAQLKNLDAVVARETGIPVHLAQSPSGTVLKGVRHLLQDHKTFTTITRGSELILS